MTNNKELGLKDLRRKITDEQKQNILKLREQGLAYRVISEQAGVSYVMVYSICNPKYYQKTVIPKLRRSGILRYAKMRDRSKYTEYARRVNFRRKLAKMKLKEKPQE